MLTGLADHDESTFCAVRVPPLSRLTQYAPMPLTTWRARLPCLDSPRSLHLCCRARLFSRTSFCENSPQLPTPAPTPVPPTGALELQGGAYLGSAAEIPGKIEVTRHFFIVATRKGA